MGKLVLFKAYRGDVDQGLSVILQIGDEGQPYHTEINGNLPPIPEISQYYREHPNLARRPKKRKIIREVSSRIMGRLYKCCL